MPTTSSSSFTASITVALMALLMPGAGPPPTRMPRRLCGVFIGVHLSFIDHVPPVDWFLLRRCPTSVYRHHQETQPTYCHQLKLLRTPPFELRYPLPYHSTESVMMSS